MSLSGTLNASQSLSNSQTHKNSNKSELNLFNKIDLISG